MTNGNAERLALINGRVFLDQTFVTGHTVLVEDRSIAAILSDHETRSARLHDLRGRLLLPGFIDLQVNGGGGVLFNDRRISTDGA